MNKQVDTYSNLCTQVYEMKTGPAPEHEYLFYRSYVREAGGHILEPMCGSGRFFLPLLKEGFCLYGFDKSKQMLELLFAKAKQYAVSPHVWYDMIESFAVNLRYNLIFIPAGSFNLLAEEKVILKALKNMFHYLAPGGIFLVEIITPFWHTPRKGVWYESTWPKADGSAIVVTQFNFPSPSHLSHSVAKYKHIKDGHVLGIEVEEYLIRMYKVQEFTRLLRSVGFSTIKTIKPFDRTKKPLECEETIIFECHK